MKLVIGLVVKGGKQFIDKWIDNIERIKCGVIVVDNGADLDVRNKLINHKYILQYHIQNDKDRNQSRDYQKILDMAREEDADWIWNLDIDEYVPEIDIEHLLNYLLNTRDDSVGVPLFEMRNDDQHYVLVADMDGKLKHGRMCHKIYKVHSHFAFNQKDKHGSSIPHNCKAGELYFMPYQHYGHLTKEQRDQKKKEYEKFNFKNYCELKGNWMKEDDEVEIKEWGDWNKK